MNWTVKWCPGTLYIHNDLYVCISSVKEHDRSLLMSFANKNVLMFSNSKFQIKWPKITFYGTVFSI